MDRLASAGGEGDAGDVQHWSVERSARTKISKELRARELNPLERTSARFRRQAQRGGDMRQQQDTIGVTQALGGSGDTGLQRLFLPPP